MHARTKGVGQTVLRVVGAVIAAPFVVMARLDAPLESAGLLFAFGGHSLAVLPGFVGNAARAAYYRRTLAAFEAGACVHFGRYFSRCGAVVRAGAGIGAYCVIGLVTIGPRMRIASRVSVMSGLHYRGSAAQRRVSTRSNGRGSARTAGLARGRWWAPMWAQARLSVWVRWYSRRGQTA